MVKSYGGDDRQVHVTTDSELVVVLLVQDGSPYISELMEIDVLRLVVQLGVWLKERRLDPICVLHSYIHP